MAIAPAQHIEITPGVCGGRPRFPGHPIRVPDIYVWRERMGESPDDNVSEIPQLTLADIYAALAWFWDHRDEILEDMKRQDAFVEEMKARYPSKLREKLKQMGRGDAFSP